MQEPLKLEPSLRNELTAASLTRRDLASKVKKRECFGYAAGCELSSSTFAASLMASYVAANNHSGLVADPPLQLPNPSP